jgi:hypothetical protein
MVAMPDGAAASAVVPVPLAVALAADGEPLQLPGFHGGVGGPLAAETTGDAAEPSSLCSSVSSEDARCDSGGASPEMPNVVQVPSLAGRRPPPSPSATGVSTDGEAATSLPPPRYTPVKITTVVWQSRTLTRAEALERARAAQARARERRAQQQQQLKIQAN